MEFSNTHSDFVRCNSEGRVLFRAFCVKIDGSSWKLAHCSVNLSTMCDWFCPLGM